MSYPKLKNYLPAGYGEREKERESTSGKLFPVILHRKSEDKQIYKTDTIKDTKKSSIYLTQHSASPMPTNETLQHKNRSSQTRATILFCKNFSGKRTTGRYTSPLTHLKFNLPHTHPSPKEAQFQS